MKLLLKGRQNYEEGRMISTSAYPVQIHLWTCVVIYYRKWYSYLILWSYSFVLTLKSFCLLHPKKRAGGGGWWCWRKKENFFLFLSHHILCFSSPYHVPDRSFDYLRPITLCLKKFTDINDLCKEDTKAYVIFVYCAKEILLFYKLPIVLSCNELFAWTRRTIIHDSYG